MLGEEGGDSLLDVVALIPALLLSVDVSALSLSESLALPLGDGVALLLASKVALLCVLGVRGTPARTWSW